ncbi:sigma factor-like helix-turn-helix DNA-binding protein [Marinitoga lauensis]|uniref:sigma factor-like helix-turn-helix DNA-binding protein n=1 Tax=Marinitoga lauensis TaxID=2201189 RepID=UPI001011D571|nr:sigma factor-like helix-turn-helix DNA-binding protein [Marinitoga lauensis]
MDALVIIKVVEEWLELLTSHEKEVIFWRYINHDFERTLNKKMKYKTLSYAEIAKKMNLDRKCIWRIEKKAFKKILA